MPIRPLPPLLIDQIAAGEVVERPASVVKELVENAVDAGARSVRVGIEAGGRRLIAVRDDGIGIPPDELPLALAPHATSKIAEAEDLEAIDTMGFRGEALASIAAVARVRIVSRPPDAEAGAEIAGTAGVIDSVRPTAAPPGTLIEVRDLFHSVPARRRFLKSDQAEATRVGETMRLLALAHPATGMRYEVEGRVRLDLGPDRPLEERITGVVGDEFAPHLHPVDHVEAGVRVSGLVGDPELAKSTAKAIRVVMNGRPITDRTVLHAVREGYRGLIEPGRSPVVVLYIVVDPRRVDVNVHPQKTEVRFRDGAAVHAAVRHAVKRALSAADILPTVDLSRAGGGTVIETTPGIGASGTAGSAPGGWSSRATSEPGRIGGGTGPVTGMPSGRPVVLPELRAALEAPAAEDAGRAALLDQVAGGVGEAAATEPAGDSAAPLLAGARAIDRVMQVHDMFLVTSDAEGLLIIDQHALHERIVFEELANRIAGGTLESQPRLVPLVVPVPPEHIEHLESLAPLFTRLGLEVGAMGPDSVAVHAEPSLLRARNVDTGAFVEDLLRRTDEDGVPPDTEAALADILDMLACKAAVKAGDRLTEADMVELLEARERFERSDRCPHGRPTTLRLTVHDLERQFGRR